MSLLAFALALSGCSRPSSPQQAAGEHHHETGITFSAKRGLHIPAETAEFIGLKLAEVEERTVRSEFRFSAQVYRTTSTAQHTPGRPEETVVLASGDISPEEARVLSPGQGVTVLIDGGRSLAGRILEIHAHTDRSVEHVDVTVAIDDRNAELGAERFVTVTAPVGGDRTVASIPRQALLETAEGKFVYTASGEHFVRTAVKTGVMNAEYAEIIDGLYTSDQVVTNAVMTLWMAELQSIRGGKACADGH